MFANFGLRRNSSAEPFRNETIAQPLAIIMKIALLSIFILVITSGKSQNLDITDIVITSDFIDPVSLGKLNPTNQELYLTIESRYDECGEWGGHYEKTTVSSDSTGTIQARY